MVIVFECSFAMYDRTGPKDRDLPVRIMLDLAREGEAALRGALTVAVDDTFRRREWTCDFTTYGYSMCAFRDELRAMHDSGSGSARLFDWDEETVICALDLEPSQVRIAGYIGRPPERHRQSPGPELVRIDGGRIVAEVWSRRG